MATKLLSGLAMLPVALHLLTGLGVVYEWGSLLAQKDSFDWWVATTINCFRLGPSDGQLSLVAACIQIGTAFVVMATQISSSFSVRRVGYALLVALYSVTQLRHIVMGEGPEAKSQYAACVTMATKLLSGLAMLPVALHLLTGLGVVYKWGSLLAQKDSFDWWVATTIHCFRLGPSDGQLSLVAACIQIGTAFVVMATQISSSFSVRRVGYALLVALYSVTQLRHIVMGEGPEAVGFFYTHILIYAVIVFYCERTCSTSVK